MARKKKIDKLWDDADTTLPINDEQPKPKTTQSKVKNLSLTKRYTVAVQKENDLYCYQYFFESDSLDTAKLTAEKKVDALQKSGKDLGVIIYDTAFWFSTYRYNLPASTGKGDRIKSWVKC